MWAGVDNFVHEISEAWPVVASIGGIGIYFIGLFARSKANDKEIIALTKTVESLVKTVATVEEKISRLQSNIEFNTQRLTDTCRDIVRVAERVDKNTDNINYMLGRMDFGTRQRKDNEPKR